MDKPIHFRRGVSILSLLCSLFLIVAEPTVHGGEVISNFDSHVVIEPDGAVLVSEKITVIATGDRIKRGIYRDFPLKYRDAKGRTEYADFEVVSVSLDGRPLAEYEVEKTHDNVRVMMGDRRKFLDSGTHVFTLAYRTTTHEQTFEDYDELNWNVTGNQWAFPIEAASCRIELPEGGNITKTAAWLGKSGGRDSPVIVTRSNPENAFFIAELPISPGGHFTVAVAFDKGLVTIPQKRESAPLSPLASFIVAFLAAAYFLVAWLIWGKDPEPGLVAPLFYPPQAGWYGKRSPESEAISTVMSPAAVQYVADAGKMSDSAVASLFISLAVKGRCRLGRNAKDVFVVTAKERGPDAPELSPEEEIVYNELLRNAGVGYGFEISQNNRSALRIMRQKIAKQFYRRYAPLWAHNSFLSLLGWFVVLPLALYLTHNGAGPAAETLLPLAALVFVAYRIRTLFESKLAVFFVQPGKRLFEKIFIGIIINEIDVDSLGEPLVRQIAGQLHDTALGSRIGGNGRPSEVTGHGSDVDDFAPALGNHDACGKLALYEHGGQVDGEDVVPIREREILGGIPALNARRRSQNVQIASERRDAFLERGIHFLP